MEITAQKPYHLPGKGATPTPKSLKELGLDTTVPGTYPSTGLYEETVSKRADKTVMWTGSITSNTITVEVKK